MLRPLLLRARELAKTIAYAEALPRWWRILRATLFWDRQAELIHARWGGSSDDLGVVCRILETYRPASVLDIGCGSGRLFELYRERGVREVTGVDISAAALAHARRKHPDVPTTQMPLQRADFLRRFDLIISNRVLQHIPRADIGPVVKKLCAASQFVYVNELSASDEVAEDWYLMRHDYEALFGALGWGTVERGRIGKQTFLLFQAPRPGGPSEVFEAATQRMSSFVPADVVFALLPLLT